MEPLPNLSPVEALELIRILRLVTADRDSGVSS